MVTARKLTTPFAPEAGCFGSYGASGEEFPSIDTDVIQLARLSPKAASQTGQSLTTLEVPLIAVGASMTVRGGGGSCATHGLHVDVQKEFAVVGASLPMRMRSSWFAPQ